MATVKRNKKQLNSALKPIAAAVLAMLSAPAAANPAGGQVVHGSATIHQAGNTLTITNSPNAIINWQSFGINRGEITRIVQQSPDSKILNRVVGGDPSVLLGTMWSNGKVFLVNPAGILVGQGARIDVAKLVLSTLNISNDDFLRDRYNFTPALAAGGIINHGNITTPEGGSVYLVAPNVENHGIISTPRGETILAAGNTVKLLDTGTPGVSVEITGNGNAVNLGQILADSGRIGMVGAVVRNSGTLNANSLANEGGRIFLKASQSARVDGNANITATGVKGGDVRVLANEVTVTDNAAINVSGQANGGQILIGGDYQGKNPEVRNAQSTYLGENATLTADGGVPSPQSSSEGATGDGGKIIVWADEMTQAHGRISARGGILGGNGGLVETSAHNLLIGGLKVDTTAPRGKFGTWLLDPVDFTISLGNGAQTINSIGADTLADALNANNVIIQTDASTAGHGDIRINADIHKSGAVDTSLSLLSHRDITLNNNTTIDSINSRLDVTLVSNLSGNGGAILLKKGSSISTHGGDITLTGGVGGNASSGYAQGRDNSGSYSNGILIDGATLSSAGGNITLRGRGAATNDSAGVLGITSAQGISIGDSTDGSQPVSINSGGGKIYMEGISQSADTNAHGIELGVFGGSVTLASASGAADAIKLVGNASAASSSDAYGILARENTNISVTSANGGIHIEGYGKQGAQSALMLRQTSGVISTVNGAINIISHANAGHTGSGDITINGNIVSATGKVKIRADVDGTGIGTVNFDPDDGRINSGGHTNIYYNPGAYDDPSDFSDLVTGSGGHTAWMLVNNVNQLQAMDTNLAGNYALGRSIDASATSGWNSGAGFAPIGGSADPFTGKLNGLGNSIDNLHVNRPGQEYVGLFGYLLGGEIKNVTLVNADITGADHVGALAGKNNGGWIKNVHVSGSVNGHDGVGGVVGWNYYDAYLTHGSSTAVVNGNGHVGGVAGKNHGSIDDSSASGNVSGDYSIGGLVGYNEGFISNSDVSGEIYLYSEGAMGGLVGYNVGGISNSHYNIDEVHLNDAHIVTRGGLYGAQFDDWLGNGRNLNISNYYGMDVDGYHTINNVQGLKDLLGFAEDNTYKFRLTENIDLTGNANFFLPVFAAQELDGGGHTISNLFVDQYMNDDIGFIGSLAGGSYVHRLQLANITVTGGNNVGGLAGSNHGTIDNVFVSGSINGNENIGGLVGLNSGNISNTHTSGTVGGYRNVGGLVGYLFAPGNVSSIVSTSVDGTNPSPSGAASISNSYSVAAVNGEINPGGLVGYNEGGTVSGSFWDVDTSGQDISDGGIGLTTAQMKTAATFTDAGWDSAVWNIADGMYPTLTMAGPSPGCGYDICWDGGGGDFDWLNPLNWTNDIIPGTDSDVFIDAAGGAINLAGLSDSFSIASLTSNESLVFNGGAFGLTIGGDTHFSNDTLFSVNGGSVVFNGATTLHDFVLNDGNAEFGGNATLHDLALNNGVLGGGGTISVTHGFDQDVAAVINRSGAMDITQQAGDLAFSASNVGTVNLNANAGNILLGAINSSGAITAKANGALTVNGTLAAAATGDAIRMSGSRFVNNAGVNALSTPNGRWLVWSGNADPFGGGTSDDRGGLVYSFKQYGFNSVNDTVLGAGNGFLYSYAPTVSVGLTGTVNKTYNGNNSAELLPTNYSVSGVVDGDDIELDTLASGTYADKNFGVNKLVTVSNISISSAHNSTATVYGYQLASDSASANIGNIDQAALTLNAVADTKVYDGNTASGGAVNIVGLADGDTVSGLTQAFDSKNAGARTLAVSGYAINDGNGGNNYIVTTNTAAGAIDQAALTLNAVADTKVYDGNTASGGAVNVVGLADGDTVSGLTQAFDSKNAGARTLAVSGYAIDDGNGGNNYVVTTNIAAGTIDRKALTIAGSTAADKFYDGNTHASITVGALSGFVGTETVSVTASGSFDNKNAAAGKPVDVAYTLANGANGGQASNYSLANETLSANVDRRPVVFTVDPGQGKLQGTPDPAYIAFNDEGGGMGMVAGESPVGVLVRAPGEAPGNYAVQQGTLTNANNPNYGITFVGGNFTIVAAPTPPAPTPPGTQGSVQQVNQIAMQAINQSIAGIDQTISSADPLDNVVSPPPMPPSPNGNNSIGGVEGGTIGGTPGNFGGDDSTPSSGEDGTGTPDNNNGGQNAPIGSC